MTPEERDLKQRIANARVAYTEAISYYHGVKALCTHTAKLQRSWGSVSCEVCGKGLGWWCPKSPNNLCDYDPPGDFDHCRFCGNPEERK